MDDLHAILASHISKKPRTKHKNSDESESSPSEDLTRHSVPDILFDHVLVNLKLSRVDTLVLVYLHRNVYEPSNPHSRYGISQRITPSEIAEALRLDRDDVLHALLRLGDLDLVETIRDGQYFVRRYFTAELDQRAGVHYEEY